MVGRQGNTRHGQIIIVAYDSDIITRLSAPTLWLPAFRIRKLPLIRRELLVVVMTMASAKGQDEGSTRNESRECRM